MMEHRQLAKSFYICSFCAKGSKPLDTISDYAQHGFDLQGNCRNCV